MVSVAFLSPNAVAEPQGASVASGNITISQPAAGQTLINQTSQKGIIDWQSFSIAAGEHTHFAQPNSSAITLNRVTGGNPSAIFGKLTATGQVFLLNPSGIVFGPSAQIDVAGLLATTADISNADFLAGKLDFNQPGLEGAKIVNRGTLTAHDNGTVYLVGDVVENDGTITAINGAVTLAAAPTFYVDAWGDGLIHLPVNNKTASQLNPNAATPYRVRNSGTITADGGQVTLKTNIEGVTETGLSILNEGTINARTLAGNKGEAQLVAGKDGTVAIIGSIDVSGLYDGASGGDITVSADGIAIDNATLNADGHSGGGTILIGGDIQGSGTLPTANTLYVGADTQIKASAIAKGDGGKVVLWSNDDTIYHGQITAKGGAESGNGGFAEVSGKQTLTYRGLADLSAENGELGMLLLDPQNITIAPLSFDPTDIGSMVFWFDAENNVTLAGGAVSSWGDQQPASGNNNATEGTASERPQRLLESLNGRDTIRFDGSNDRLIIANNGAINTSTFNQKSMVLSFKTGANVTNGQMIYEQGGGTNGYSYYIENGNLYIGGWRNSGAAINNYAATSVSANTAYTATMIWDRTSQTYTAYLNGDEVGNFNIGNNAQNSHSGNITIGYNSDSRRFNGSTAGNNSPFGGEIGEFIQYNTALTTTERKNLDQYMSLRWSPTLSAPGEDYTFSLETLEAQLPKANITLMAEDNITIADIADNSLDLAFDANGSLTMIADNNGDGVGTISMDASDRIVTQGGALTLRGADLSLAALESNGGNITLDATNNITYNSLNAGSGAITVNLDNNNNSLSTLSAGVTTADSIILNGGTDLNDTLTVTGNIAATGAGGVQINNFQTANLGADLTMGNQNFSVSTLNTTTNATLNTGTGTFTVDTLGGTADLTVTATNANATINTGIATTGGVNINTGTGNISVNGAITQADDITLTSNGGNIVLASAVNNTGNLNFNAGAGNVTLNGALGQTTAVQSLTATAANINTLRVKTTGAQTYNGPITLNNDLETAGGNVTFNGDVTLGANTDITTNNGNVAFTQSLDGTKNIGITAGTGTVNFASSGQNTRLREVDVYSAGNVTFNNNFDALEVDIRSTGAVTGGLITTDRLGVGGSSATLTGVVEGLTGKATATVTTKLSPSGTGPFTINGFTFPPVIVAAVPTQQPRSLDRVNQFASNTGGQTALLVNEGRVGTSGGSRIVNPAQGVRTSALTKPNNPYSNDFKLVEPAKGQEAAYRGVSYLFNDLWSYLSKRGTADTKAQPDTLARKQ